MAEDVVMHIFEQDYPLRISSDSGRQRLEIVAELVDRKMKEVAARYVSLTTREIAVLAALNLADDYIQLQEKLSTGGTELGDGEQASEQMIAYARRIDSFLEKQSG